MTDEELQTNLRECGKFDVRARKAFCRLGIETLGQLLEHTADDLLAVKNFGSTSLMIVRDSLERYWSCSLNGEGTLSDSDAEWQDAICKMEDEAKEEHFKEQDAAAKRFRYLLQHLWRWDRSKMARDLGILRGVVTQIARGDTGPAASTMRKLAEDPRVNAEWVMTGEGVPLKEQEAEAGEQQELIAALKDIAKAIREHTAATVQGQEAEPFSICYEKE